jgi:hypothetical protein
VEDSVAEEAEDNNEEVPTIHRGYSEVKPCKKSWR